MSQFIEMFGDTHMRSDHSRQWKEVVEIINGKDYKSIQVEDGGYPVYGTGGEMARASDYLSPANSILLGRKGTIDKPLLIREKYWNVDTAFGAVPDEKVLHYVYFYWHCKTIDFNVLNKGTTLPSTTKVDLLNLWIKIPSMEEQTRFGSIVEQADKSEFVGCKSQFIEMFGNPVTNTKGWKTAKIKDVAPEMPSKEQLSGKIWLLNLDMIESNTGRIIEKVYEDVENALSVQSFDEGNVLFSKLRPYLNKVVIPDEPGMATTELVPLRPEPSKLHKVFLSHMLRGNQFVNYANDIAGGTKMPRMPLTELRNFDCILPPMDKQLEFVFIAEQADKSEYYN